MGNIVASAGWGILPGLSDNDVAANVRRLRNVRRLVKPVDESCDRPKWRWMSCRIRFHWLSCHMRGPDTAGNPSIAIYHMTITQVHKPDEVQPNRTSRNVMSYTFRNSRTWLSLKKWNYIHDINYLDQFCNKTNANLSSKFRHVSLLLWGSCTNPPTSILKRKKVQSNHCI